MSKTALDLLREGPVVINVGVIEFGESVAEQEAEVIHVDWAPPVGRDEELDKLLDQLL